MGGIASIQPATEPLPFSSFLHYPKNCHFDRSRSCFCERDSGEIRFSTSTFKPRGCPIHRAPCDGIASTQPATALAFVLVFLHRPTNRHFDQSCSRVSVCRCPGTKRRASTFGIKRRALALRHKPRSAEGPSVVQREKQLILLPLLSPLFFFAIFRPKIACQAPKPPNPLPTNNIRVAF
jgi:hypothetical protein